jgi:Flp pilus assembly pilin Flp
MRLWRSDGAIGIIYLVSTLDRQRQMILLKGKGARMNAINRFYVRIRESSSGQTMTEYVLIVTAVAVVVYAGYQSFGVEVSASVTATNNLM